MNKNFKIFTILALSKNKNIRFMSSNIIEKLRNINTPINPPVSVNKDQILFDKIKELNKVNNSLQDNFLNESNINSLNTETNNNVTIDDKLNSLDIETNFNYESIDDNVSKITTYFYESEKYKDIRDSIKSLENKSLKQLLDDPIIKKEWEESINSLTELVKNSTDQNSKDGLLDTLQLQELIHPGKFTKLINHLKDMEGNNNVVLKSISNRFIEYDNGKIIIDMEKSGEFLESTVNTILEQPEVIGFATSAIIPVIGSFFLYKKVNKVYADNYIRALEMVDKSNFKGNQLKYFNKETARNLKYFSGLPAILITISLTTISALMINQSRKNIFSLTTDIAKDNKNML